MRNETSEAYSPLMATANNSWILLLEQPASVPFSAISQKSQTKIKIDSPPPHPIVAFKFLSFLSRFYFYFYFSPLSLHLFPFLNIYHNLPYIRLNATYPLWSHGPRSTPLSSSALRPRSQSCSPATPRSNNPHRQIFTQHVFSTLWFATQENKQWF